MRTIALTRCPTCGGEQSEAVELGLRRCLACGTVHAAEYADPDEVFREGYLSGGTGAFGIDVSHPRFQAYLRDVGEARCRIIERVAGVRPPARLLDVGCGSGELLEAAVARGWQAVGVEPLEDASATARSRGLDVRTALLQDSGLPEDSYDVVSAFHVLEHMPDAPTFLALLARWARRGGVVVIESPNWDSRMRAASGSGWMHLRPLEHLVHFSPATLRKAFFHAGLQTVAVRSPTHVWSENTLDESLQVLGRPGWKRLRRLPGFVVRPMLRAAEAADDRAGRGAVVLGVARRPANDGELPSRSPLRGGPGDVPVG